MLLRPDSPKLSQKSACCLGGIVALAALRIRAFDGLNEGQRRAIEEAASYAVDQEARDVVQRSHPSSDNDGAHGYHSKAALTVLDVPLPTTIAREVADLTYDYGDARRWASEYILGRGVNYLPKTGTQPDFKFILLTDAPDELTPAWSQESFEGKRIAGTVRIPREIDEATLPFLGQRVAKYCAQRSAKLEDQTLFLGDGTAGYGLFTGAGPKAVADGKVVQLSAGKTAADAITLTDLRLLRRKVNADYLSECAYFTSQTNEQLLSMLNKDGNKPYIPEGLVPRLDGFPVRFISIMPTYDEDPHASQVQFLFGKLEHWFLLRDPQLLIRVSAPITSPYDELRIMAIEKIAIAAMADDAIAALQLAAA